MINSQSIVYPRDSRGFTLVELMVLMTILGILVALSMPGMRTLIDNNRLSSFVNELVGAAHFARSEAVFRNKDVTLCIRECAGGEGWVVSVDLEVLKKGEALNERLELLGTSTVIFAPDGSLVSNEIEVSVSLGHATPRVLSIRPAGSIASKKDE